MNTGPASPSSAVTAQPESCLCPVPQDSTRGTQTRACLQNDPDKRAPQRDPGFTSYKWDNETRTLQAVPRAGGTGRVTSSEVGLAPGGRARAARPPPPHLRPPAVPRCPAQLERPLFQLLSLPDCGFSCPWAGPGPTTSRVKYPELTGPGFYESTSLAGGLLPSPLPVLKQLTTTPVRDAG